MTELTTKELDALTKTAQACVGDALKDADAHQVERYTRATGQTFLNMLSDVPRTMLKLAKAFAVERIAELNKTIENQRMQLETLERRASRHAEHLAALESRLKKLEHR